MRCPAENKARSGVLAWDLNIGDVETLSVAARRMVNNKIRRLLVIKHHKLIGIIVVSDFAKHLSKKTLTETVLEAIWCYPTPQ